MADKHFARVDSSNTVVGVHIIDENDCLYNGNYSPAMGQLWFQDAMGTTDRFIEVFPEAPVGVVSYRLCVPGKGNAYIDSLDVFQETRPFDTWRFDTTADPPSWQPPTNAGAKPGLTTEQSNKGYKYMFDPQKYAVDPNDCWILQAEPNALPPTCTEEQNAKECYHFWDDDILQWILITPDQTTKPSLAATAVSAGYQVYHQYGEFKSGAATTSWVVLNPNQF